MKKIFAKFFRSVADLLDKRKPTLDVNDDGQMVVSIVLAGGDKLKQDLEEIGVLFDNLLERADRVGEKFGELEIPFLGVDIDNG